MVDDDGEKRAVMGCAEILREQSQGRAVGAAGYRDGEAGVSPERSQPGQCRGERRYWQPAFLLTAAMRGARPAGGVGNWLLSEESVSQAASFWLMSARELARPSRDCGA